MKNKQSRKESTKKWGHKSTLPYHSPIDIWSTWETRSERIDRPLFRSHFLGSFFSSRRGGAFNRNNNNNKKNKKIKINPRWSIPTQVCSEKKGKGGTTTPALLYWHNWVALVFFFFFKCHQRHPFKYRSITTPRKFNEWRMNNPKNN